MSRARRPAGTPVGGQFAPTNRPEASGVELTDDVLQETPVDIEPEGEPGEDPELANFDGYCDECGAELVDEELITDQHETWCSLHPDNVVDVQSTNLPHADDPRLESSGGLEAYQRFVAQSTPLLVGELRRFSADIEVAAANKLERQHEALRGIQALLSDPEWDSPADRLETIAMLIEDAGYAHEEFRPEVGEQIELQLADRTVVGKIEMIDGDEMLVVPNSGRPVRVPTGAIEWDRDGLVWYHAPKDEER